MGRRRTTLIATLSVLIGFALAALLMEVLVRIFFDERITPRYVMDSGYGVRANQSNAVRREYWPDAYDTTVSTNSAGMRGTREYTISKPQGIERILVLGDSFAFGEGVEDDEVVSVVLEDLLNAKARKEKHYEVINFSVIAIGTAEELVTYRTVGRNYQPDTVILFYYENDIANNFRSKLYELDEEGGVRKTGNTYLPGVKLTGLIYSIPGTRWLGRHSDAWYFMLNRASLFLHRSAVRDLQFKKAADIAKDDTSKNFTKALILQLMNDIRADSARPIIVMIPSPRTALNSNFPLNTEILNESNIEFLDGREYLIMSDYYFPENDHWRASGHYKTAKKLAAMLD